MPTGKLIKWLWLHFEGSALPSQSPLMAWGVRYPCSPIEVSACVIGTNANMLRPRKRHMYNTMAALVEADEKTDEA